MNLRPEAAPTFPLPPGEGGPKGRVRERPPGSWAQVVAETRPGGLFINLRPEAAPTFPLPPGEGGPKGRVRERPPGSWAQVVAETRPGGLSRGNCQHTKQKAAASAPPCASQEAREPLPCRDAPMPVALGILPPATLALPCASRAQGCAGAATTG